MQKESKNILTREGCKAELMRLSFAVDFCAAFCSVNIFSQIHFDSWNCFGFDLYDISRSVHW